MAAPPLPLDLAVSLDTTGSMHDVISSVRANVSELLVRLLKDVADLRVGVIAHGDYGDVYETEVKDLGTGRQELESFVRDVANTHGHDAPECYELVLRQARTNLSWRRSSSKVLVVVGDSYPHAVGESRNKYGIDWEAELQLLKQMGVVVYSIACGVKPNSFFRRLAEETGGRSLELSDFASIRDFLMSVAFREAAPDLLPAFELEVRARDGPAIAADIDGMLTVMRHDDADGGVKATGVKATRARAAKGRTTDLKVTKVKTTAMKPATPATAKEAAKLKVKEAAKLKVKEAAKLKVKEAAKLKVKEAAKLKVKEAAKLKVKDAAKLKVKDAAKRLNSLRCRRETLSDRRMASRLSELRWSPWQLVARPGGCRGSLRSSWSSLGGGCVRRKVFRLSAGATHAFEVAVQPQRTGRRLPLYSRVRRSAAGGCVGLRQLLSGSATAQLLRVLRAGMFVFARVAECPAARPPAVRRRLEKSLSYAWNSCRQVAASSGVVSVGKEQLLPLDGRRWS